MLNILPFQRQFLAGALSPDIDTACLSIPRGNGKSALAGYILTRVLDPADALFRPGTESVLCAASIEQARIVFRFARAELEGRGGYRFLDSHTRIGITHVASNTRLRIIGSNGKDGHGPCKLPMGSAQDSRPWPIACAAAAHADDRSRRRVAPRSPFHPVPRSDPQADPAHSAAAPHSLPAWLASAFWRIDQYATAPSLLGSPGHRFGSPRCAAPRGEIVDGARSSRQAI